MVNEKPKCFHHPYDIAGGVGSFKCNSKIRICETFENSSTLIPTGCNYYYCILCDPVYDYKDEITGEQSYHIPGFFPIPKKMFLTIDTPVFHDICVSCYIHVRNRKLHRAHAQDGMFQHHQGSVKPKSVIYTKSLVYEEKLRLMDFGFKANLDPTFLVGRPNYFIHTKDPHGEPSAEQLKQDLFMEEFEDEFSDNRAQFDLPHYRWEKERHRLR
jgi:hypothetical protein